MCRVGVGPSVTSKAQNILKPYTRVCVCSVVMDMRLTDTPWHHRTARGLRRARHSHVHVTCEREQEPAHLHLDGRGRLTPLDPDA